MVSVVLFSGGYDSTAALLAALSQHGRRAVLALTVDYGQRHRQELIASERIATALGVTRITADARSFGSLAGGALVNRSGPEADMPLGAVAAVVPGRNLMLLSLALACCESNGGTEVWIGCNADDSAAFPDCRNAFLRAAEDCGRLALGHRIRVVTPWLSVAKRNIPETLITSYPGARDQADLLAGSWSCYGGGDQPCGVCHACVVRGTVPAIESIRIGDTDRLLRKAESERKAER